MEEIERFLEGGKRVLLYFSEQAIPQDLLDPDELKRLRDYRNACFAKGLVSDYDSVDSLLKRVVTDFTRVVREQEVPGTTDIVMVPPTIDPVARPVQGATAAGHRPI